MKNMLKTTTVQVTREVIDSLNEVKEYPRETYNETIIRIITIYKKIRAKNQYDEFLHKIQQQKMKELWDNKEDEDWEHV